MQCFKCFTHKMYLFNTCILAAKLLCFGGRGILFSINIDCKKTTYAVERTKSRQCAYNAFIKEQRNQQTFELHNCMLRSNPCYIAL